MSAATLQAAALCLEYPDGPWRAHLPLLRAAATPELRPFVAYATAHDEGQMTRHYVETFDLRRHCCLYLTYYTYGDTRKRGMALLRFSHAYRSAGFVLESGELPDHLGVVCEFAARNESAGRRLLAEHRVGIELLRLALRDASSPYVHVLAAISAVLPALSTRELERAIELARSGPPAEEVGLEPFAPPDVMGVRR